MPVTVVLEQHEPRAHPLISHAESPEQFFEQSCPSVFARGQTNVEASSFRRDSSSSATLHSSSSSFVRSAVEAWARHSHLVLRPDDIWFQILVQLNFCLQHENNDTGYLFQHRYLIPPIEIHQDDRECIHRSLNSYFLELVRQPWLADWVRPGFSTSDSDDDATAMALILGWVFTDYVAGPTAACGIPSITLLGAKEDWEHLSGKLDRIREFGPKANAYRMRLARILGRIVESFDDPCKPGIRQFWDQLVHARIKYGEIRDRPPSQYKISGWILGFFFFSDRGERDPRFSSSFEARGKVGAVEVDDVWYGEVNLQDLPLGYAGILLKARGGEAESWGSFEQGWMVAGNIGKSIVRGAPKGYLDAAAQSIPATMPGRQHSRSSSDAQDDKGGDESMSGRRRFSNLFRSLSFIGRGKEDSTPQDMPSSKSDYCPNVEEPAATVRIQVKPNHSTIQPRSGWAVFRPGIRPHSLPREPELQGSSVDAIESCEYVERYGVGRPLEYWPGPGRMRAEEWYLPPVDSRLSRRSSP